MCGPVVLPGSHAGVHDDRRTSIVSPTAPLTFDRKHDGVIEARRTLVAQ